MTKSPRANCSDFSDFIEDCLKKFDLIIPTSEPEIKKISKLYYNVPDLPVLILKNDILETFFNKHKTFLFLNSKNLSCPDTKLLKYAVDDDLPIYMKPVFGAGGRGNRILENKWMI